MDGMGRIALTACVFGSGVAMGNADPTIIVCLSEAGMLYDMHGSTRSSGVNVHASGAASTGVGTEMLSEYYRSR